MSEHNLSLLASLLELPGITDVLCNGWDDWYIDCGQGLKGIKNFAIAQTELAELARHLIELGSRHLDIAVPIADVSLTSKHWPALETLGHQSIRVHAVLESAVSEQTLISIRVHPSKAPNLQQLFDASPASQQTLRQLEEIVLRRQNFVISGPTGAGKTTLLRALLASSANLRTVVIEDTAEIMPVYGHAVGLQARQPNSDGAGQITLMQLANQALRMRPDRIVIGEVRGDEVATLIAAMNTGHAGSAATVHANNIHEVYPRLRLLLLNSGCPDAAIPGLLTAAIQVVIHLDGARRVTSIGALEC